MPCLNWRGNRKWLKMRSRLLAGLEAGSYGKPYSDDLRGHVAGSVLGGRPCRETARLFGVSVASAVKWLRRQRATGSAATKAMGGRRRPILLV
jgi:hypothetical protein